MTTSLFIGLWVLLQQWLTGPGLAEQAQTAYRQGRYAEAAGHYRRLAASQAQPDPAVFFNLANCLWLADSAQAAGALYRQVQAQLPPDAQARALNQLGILAAQAEEWSSAADFFKQALRIHPESAAARFNLELLLRQLPPPPPPPPPSGNPPPPPRITEANARPTPADQVNPTEGRQLLEQLDAAERQYLQQQRKRLRNHFQEGPDW